MGNEIHYVMFQLQKNAFGPAFIFPTRIFSLVHLSPRILPKKNKNEMFPLHC